MSDLRALAEAATPIYGGQYAVDRSGRVFSFTRWRGRDVRLLTPTFDADGYLRVRLTIKSARLNVGIHRLVAMTFLGPRPQGTEVRHLDGDKLNNRVENLAWGTKAENAADRGRHGRTARGERNGEATLTEADIRAIRYASSVYGIGQRRLGSIYGVGQRTIGRIVRRETWGHV